MINEVKKGVTMFHHKAIIKLSCNFHEKSARKLQDKFKDDMSIKFNNHNYRYDIEGIIPADVYFSTFRPMLDDAMDAYRHETIMLRTQVYRSSNLSRTDVNKLSPFKLRLEAAHWISDLIDDVDVDSCN